MEQVNLQPLLAASTALLDVDVEDMRTTFTGFYWLDEYTALTVYAIDGTGDVLFPWDGIDYRLSGWKLTEIALDLGLRWSNRRENCPVDVECGPVFDED
jgi:hypothetical protein